jgi:hypothetical protein
MNPGPRTSDRTIPLARAAQLSVTQDVWSVGACDTLAAVVLKWLNQVYAYDAKASGPAISGSGLQGYRGLSEALRRIGPRGERPGALSPRPCRTGSVVARACRGAAGILPIACGSQTAIIVRLLFRKRHRG